MSSYSASPTVNTRQPLWQIQAAAELERRRRENQIKRLPPTDPPAWYKTLLPDYFPASFAPRHHEVIDWAETIEPGENVDPFVAIWGRGGGKSTMAEAVVVRTAARRKRQYVWYICETQDQADKHVQNIASMLESAEVAKYYPELSEPLIGENKNKRGWRRSFLRCSTGFTVEAIGLNTAARGGKIDWARPDLMVFDDIDGKEDTEQATAKKERTITDSLLPAGASDLAVLFVQNLITAHSIASKLAKRGIEGAEYLIKRIISGPHQAVIDLKLEVRQDPETGEIRNVIIGGTPTWEGQDLATCQGQIDTYGPASFKRESQNEVTKDKVGALWNRDLLKRTRVSGVPKMHRIVVGVDPQSSTGQTGIVVAGIWHDVHGKLHGGVLEDATPPRGVKPDEWGSAAVAAYTKWGADSIIGEGNHGGDMIENVIRNVRGGKNVNYRMVRASRSKFTRAEPVAAIFGQGRGHMCGFFVDLEDELCGWVPGEDSPNRLDALVWAFTELMLNAGGSSGKYATDNPYGD